MNIFCVALGGGIGAVFRYILGLIPVKSEIPIMTLITNFLGALVIGIVVAYAEKKGLPKNLILFLKTGFCGGFTTFSTFSLETYQLLQNGKYIYGGAYIVFSVVLCIIGVALGMKLIG